MRKQVALLSIGLIPAEILPCCESTKRCQIKRFKNRQTTMQTIEHFKFKGWVWNPTAQQLWKVLLQILDARESDAMRCPLSMESSIIRFIRFIRFRHVPKPADPVEPDDRLFHGPRAFANLGCSFRLVGWTVSWEFCRGISFTPPAIELVGPSSDQSLVMKKFDTSSRWFLTHDHIDAIDAKSRWDGKNWCHQHLG